MYVDVIKSKRISLVKFQICILKMNFKIYTKYQQQNAEGTCEKRILFLCTSF